MIRELILDHKDQALKASVFLYGSAHHEFAAGWSDSRLKNNWRCYVSAWVAAESSSCPGLVTRVYAPPPKKKERKKNANTL